MRIRYWSSDVCSSDLVYLFVDRDGRLRHPLAMARPRRNPDPTASMKRLIAVIERFCETHRMSESGFGRGFLKDSSFVGDPRSGRRVSLEAVRKVKARLRVYATSSAVAEWLSRVR